MIDNVFYFGGHHSAVCLMQQGNRDDEMDGTGHGVVRLNLSWVARRDIGTQLATAEGKDLRVEGRLRCVPVRPSCN